MSKEREFFIIYEQLIDKKENDSDFWLEIINELELQHHLNKVKYDVKNGETSEAVSVDKAIIRILVKQASTQNNENKNQIDIQNNKLTESNQREKEKIEVLRKSEDEKIKIWKTISENYIYIKKKHLDLKMNNLENTRKENAIDIKYQKDLLNIEDKKIKQNKKSSKYKIITPILTIILTFLLVTWVGGNFQENSFNKGIVFQAQLKRFQKAEIEVTEIEFDLRDVYARIAWDKFEDSKSSRYNDFLLKKRDDIEILSNKLRGFPSIHRKKLNKSVLDSIKNIDLFLKGDGDLDLKYIRKLKEDISDALIAFLDTPRV